MNKFKLTVSDWKNGIWGNRNIFFKTLEDAKKELKKLKGRLKIYDDKKQVVVSEDIDNETYA